MNIVDRKDVLVSSLRLPDNYVIDDAAVKDIASSIKEVGLFYPLIIKPNGLVVVGRKRFVAHQQLELAVISCIIVSEETTDQECQILSLHENLKRSNLPWYDQVIKEKELHDLRQDQHGTGKRGKKVGWSLRETAKELNIALGTLSEDLRMAEAVLADPTLAKIQDKTTAKRVILASIKRNTQEMEAGLIPVDCNVDVVHCGSSEEILKSYSNNVFDACITDPPWLEYKDRSLIKDGDTMKVFPELYRTMKSNSFLYMFVSTADWFIYQQELPSFGFTVQKWPLIWIKENVLTHGTRSWEYQRDFELVLLAVKGSPALCSTMLSAIYSCKVLHPSKMIHPNQKPSDIIHHLIDHCTFDESVIVDPFAGSGVVGEACRESGRHYVLIERNPSYATAIRQRLED